MANKVNFITEDGLQGIEVDGEKLFNACNHPVSVLTKTGVVKIPQAGTVIRAEVIGEDVEYFVGVKIVRPLYGDINGLPPEKPKVMYLASSPAINTLNDSRRDVIAIGETHKSEGKILVLSFRRKY